MAIDEFRGCRDVLMSGPELKQRVCVGDVDQLTDRGCPVRCFDSKDCGTGMEKVAMCASDREAGVQLLLNVVNKKLKVGPVCRAAG